MRAATWNADHVKLTDARRSAQVATVREAGADVWVFTEADTSLVPSDHEVSIARSSLRRTRRSSSPFWRPGPFEPLPLAELPPPRAAGSSA